MLRGFFLDFVRRGAHGVGEEMRGRRQAKEEIATRSVLLADGAIRDRSGFTGRSVKTGGFFVANFARLYPGRG